MQTFLLLVLVAISVVNNGESARILAAIPIPSYSHQVFYQMLWRELAIRGHDVVVLTSNPTHENLTNFKEIDMSVTYTVKTKAFADVIVLNDDKIAAFNRLVDYYFEVSEFELALPQVQELINDESQHFDLVMIEYLFPSFFAFKHRFNCPFIGVTTMEGVNFAHDTMGNPTNAILYPTSLLATPAEMSFKDRLVSFVLNQLIKHLIGKGLPAINDLNRKYFGDDCPDIEELMDSVDMLFVNANPMFTHIRPLTPSTISLAGGMHIKPPKALPADLQIFMDDSPQGVVYFSLGNNVKSKDLSNATLQVIIETFSRLPFNVLWKSEANNLPSKPDNVKIIKWAPQQDVLRHNNVKLFITQAGMLSLEEALFSHVPLITMPFLGDQNANAVRVAYKEIGLNLNYKTLNVEEFKASITEVITNPKYKENIKRFALQIQDQPMTPLEKAVWWTEYILRHKTGKHLRGPKIPTYQYYYLDVLAFLGTCLAAMLMLTYLSCKFAYKFVVGLFQRVTTKVKKA